MTAVAGAFGPAGDLRRAIAATAPDADTLDEGPLVVAWGGAEAHDDGRVKCVLWGRVANAEALATQLGPGSGAGGAGLAARAYLAWGHDFPSRLRGDFALLVWDREKQQALLARDHLGGESLFVFLSGSTVFFASELSPMLTLLPRRPGPDEVFLAHWLSVSDAPGRTPYSGIAPMPPGHVMIVAPNERRCHAYWRLAFSRPAPITLASAAERVDQALREAVARGAGRSNGILISGGLDSSSVAALSPRARGYALTFPGLPRVDETRWITTLADRLGLDGRRLAFYGGSMLGAAIESVSRWQVPLRPQNLGYFELAVRAAAADGVDVVLDGEGGDLLFGPVRELMADYFLRGSVRGAVSLARRLPGAGKHPSRRRVAELVWAHGLRAALPASLQRRVTSAPRPRWLPARMRRLVSEMESACHWARADGPRWWARRVADLRHGIEAIAVRDWVRRRAALGDLSAASPFFDVDLLELIMRLPPELAYDPGLDRPLLREVMRGRLPEQVRLRAGKTYFNALMVDRLAGPDYPAIVRLLAASDAKIREWVEPAVMRREILEAAPAGHQGGATAWATLTWRLITAECWLRQQEDASFSARELERGPIAPPAFETLGIRSVG